MLCIEVSCLVGLQGEESVIAAEQEYRCTSAPATFCVVCQPKHSFFSLSFCVVYTPVRERLQDWMSFGATDAWIIVGFMFARAPNSAILG